MQEWGAASVQSIPGLVNATPLCDIVGRMASNQPIQILPDHVANKIAAGEVVDRPASVVKELVENALDAGARTIEIEVVAGGRKYLSVSDDGSGMSRDDAVLSVERHATSKIRDVDDIESVHTLGFRGEALAAIASVSRFTLTTRRREDISGTEITMAGGRILDVQETGCPSGARVQVRNLFFNVPARRKFLRTEQTELSHVRQTFLLYALSHPDRGWRLSVDERDVHRLPEDSTLPERLTDLFGAGYLDQVRPIDYQRGDIRVHGYAGLPHAARSDRSEQYIFVNGRPASAPLLGHALAEGYHTLVPRGRYPLIFLFIELPPGQVDVNVHPAKKEVRFRQTGQVRDAVIEAIRTALARPGEAAPPPSGSGWPELETPTVRSGPTVTIDDLPEARLFRYPKMPALPSMEEKPDARIAGGRDDADESKTDAGEEPTEPWSWCRVLGQVGGLYVVLETGEGLVLMDPHAAHERLLFERFMKQAMEHTVRSQGLLTPETVELPPKDALMVRRNLDLLKSMGFGISDFGGDSFLVDALPQCLGNLTAETVLVEVAQGLDVGGARAGSERWSEERVARAACRAAVKARDRLALQEIEQLVIDLAGADMPYTCPHGRPTLIFMGFNELDRKFGRE